jgi:hypothetical protein
MQTGDTLHYCVSSYATGWPMLLFFYLIIERIQFKDYDTVYHNDFKSNETLSLSLLSYCYSLFSICQTRSQNSPDQDDFNLYITSSKLPTNRRLLQTGHTLILICLVLYTTSSLMFLTFHHFNNKKQRDDTTSGDPFPSPPGITCKEVVVRLF